MCALVVPLAGACSSEDDGGDDDDDDTTPYYEGKTLQLQVGFAVDGGYDKYARAIAPFLSQHIPGNPTVVVDNMDSNGSLDLANYMFSDAPVDGTMIGSIGGGLIVQQALGNPDVQFDATEFEWIGSPAIGTPACGVMSHSGATTMEDLIASKTPIKFGSTGKGATTDDLPRLLVGMVGANIEITAGYGGTSELVTEMGNDVLDGACWTWESMRNVAGDLIADPDDPFNIFVTGDPDAAPELADVPNLEDYITDAADLAAYKAWRGPYQIFRPILAPPGTPPEAMAILRQAFEDTMMDPAFLDAAAEAKLDVAPKYQADMEQAVDEILAMDEAAKARLREVLEL
jgi:tripartite-type tricarboxylate transporter receptor subunit TctC